MPQMPTAGFRWTGETVIKRSRFIATVARADTETAARAVIASVRAAYPDASHHCVAFVLNGGGTPTAHTSDDGEPPGTAGMPMLRVLLSAELTNVVTVVTRYFGGIKLGAGGLARAYSGCVADAVAVTPRVVRQVRQVWALYVPYSDAGRVQEELLRDGCVVVGADHDDSGVRLRLTFEGDAQAAAARAMRGAAEVVPDGVVEVEVPVPVTSP